MKERFFIQGLLWIYTISILACESGTSSEWVLLSEDSEGQPTFIDAASISLRDEGIAVYRRVVGDPSAVDRVELVQGLDCVNLRWALLTLDESLLDSIAGVDLAPEGWSLLALNQANRVLLNEVCESFSPTRWVRVLNEDTAEPGDLKEVWVDRETITGPGQDTVLIEFEDPGHSEEVFRVWSRWNIVPTDSGYVMVQADVACDQRAFRYLENSRYSRDGELVRQAETPDFWFSMFPRSFEEQVYTAACDMGRFFEPEITR